MATAKQTAANCMNAQKSTGPRTTAGKAASRFNALKHGIYAVHQIMFDEKPEDLAELAAEYHEHHNPADSDQRFLVDTLVHNEWRLRRTRRVEAELWQSAYDLFIVRNIDTTSTCTSGDAFATDSAIFERLQRVVNSCERVYHRAHKELERLQEAARTHSPGSPQPEAEPAPTPEPTPQPAADPTDQAEPAPQPKQSKPTSGEMGSIRQFPEPGQTHAVQPSNPSPNPRPEAENTPTNRPKSDGPKSA
jgi:hypothetical protein